MAEVIDMASKKTVKVIAESKEVAELEATLVRVSDTHESLVNQTLSMAAVRLPRSMVAALAACALRAREDALAADRLRGGTESSAALLRAWGALRDEVVR